VSARSVGATIVVPCFDEEHRLDRERFAALARTPSIRLLFVDDGSRDGTLRVLRDLEARGAGRIEVLALPHNVGKGEAVRAAMNHAIASGATIVGYIDADLSTPPSEAVRLVGELDRRGLAVVVGSRVRLVGHHIERRFTRHALGRVFVTIADAILRMPFYDTQCGAKFFRVTPLLCGVLAEPFCSRWAFDVELLGRLLAGTRDVPAYEAGDIAELPLLEWVDVGESKLRLAGMARTLVDLAKIERSIARLRREAARAPRPSPAEEPPLGTGTDGFR
jgi:dolichyl-phosphate beta-glucosyltransferase